MGRTEEEEEEGYWEGWKRRRKERMGREEERIGKRKERRIGEGRV